MVMKATRDVVEKLIEQLRRELPPLWDRKNTTKLTGGAVHHRHLANLMSLGQGPGGAIHIGRNKVVIARDPFLEWLRSRMLAA